jgi:ClpX C4-type zinc finger
MAQRSADADPACSFCGRRQPSVKLIAGPTLMICSECVARSMDIEGDRGAQSVDARALSVVELTRVPNPQGLFSRLFRTTGGKHARESVCAFCGKSPPDLVQPPSPLGLRALICPQCLALCQDIIRERLP